MKTTNVVVYLADTRSHDCEALAGQLCRASRERLVHLTHPRRRAQFILGRCLLGRALREKYPVLATGWRLEVIGGKPHLIGAGAPEISLSHSREQVACALAQVAIGLDVEYCRERDFPALAEQICSPEEWRRFRLLPAAVVNEHFYRLWTLKEARFKLDGRPMPQPDQDGELRHVYFLPGEGYLGALVARTRCPLNPVLHHSELGDDDGRWW
jgi:phosphopantetheinyl transferase